jgi:D-alanyl-D-alanine carboxypeptidase
MAIAAVLLGMSALCASSPALAGHASIIIDEATGDILSEANADELNHPASLTKMMTLYLAFEAMQKGRLHWDQRLPVSAWASEKMPTKLGLRPGDTVSVRDCVLGMIVLSANDAATVMGETLGGTEQGFARIMTAKARELGMTSTVFKNAAGLPDEEQVTTARDLVKLAMALYEKFPEQYHYFSTREFEFRGRTIHGHNHLMYRYPGMDGLKTGFTDASGFNLASSAARGDRRLFGVVMGGTSGGARDQQMADLLDEGFARGADGTMLVAKAGHMMAALSPVGRAEAAPIERASLRAAMAQAPRHGHVVTAVLAARWSVQLGAYSHPAQAEQALHAARFKEKAAEILKPSKGEHLYRARLSGFSSEQQAKDACATLHKSGHLCVVVPPGKIARS